MWLVTAVAISFGEKSP